MIFVLILLDVFGFSKQNHTFLQKHMVSLRKSKENPKKSKKGLVNPKNPIIFSFWGGRGGGGGGGVGDCQDGRLATQPSRDPLSKLSAQGLLIKFLRKYF